MRPTLSQAASFTCLACIAAAKPFKSSTAMGRMLMVRRDTLCSAARNRQQPISVMSKSGNSRLRWASRSPRWPRPPPGHSWRRGASARPLRGSSPLPAQAFGAPRRMPCWLVLRRMITGDCSPRTRNPGEKAAASAARGGRRTGAGRDQLAFAGSRGAIHIALQHLHRCILLAKL
jgi:hypothetical protein